MPDKKGQPTIVDVFMSDNDRIVKEYFEQLMKKFDAFVENYTNLYNQLRMILEDKEYRRPVFIESSFEVKDFEKRIKEILEVLKGTSPSETPTEVLIMGYFDQVVLRDLMELVKTKRRRVKLISPELTGSRHDEVNREALLKLQEAGGEVRTNKMLHARIFLVERMPQVIIGSCDLKSDCLGGRRYDAAVWSDHPELVKSAKQFFHRIWNRSNPL